MRFVARVLFSCIEGWFKGKRPETDLIESVSGWLQKYFKFGILVL